MITTGIESTNHKHVTRRKNLAFKQTKHLQTIHDKAILNWMSHTMSCYLTSFMCTQTQPMFVWTICREVNQNKSRILA